MRKVMVSEEKWNNETKRLEFCKANDGSKRIRGNGHHIRQEIAAFAVKLIKYQWGE